MNNLVPLLVAIPLGVGFIIPLAARWQTRLAGWLSTLTLAGLFSISLSLIGSETLRYHLGGWPPQIGIEMRVDDLTTLMLLLINGLGLLVGIYSIAEIRPDDSPARYHCLLMLLVAGTNGVALTGDLFNLYVFMEVTALASYALVAFSGKDESFEAALKYVVLGGLSSSVILIGVSLVYGMTGQLNMTQLAGRLSDSGAAAAPLRFALALFFCGFGLKAALVPFHAWLPDAYPAAPAPISALLSGIVGKVIGVYVLARLFFNVFGISEELLMLMQWIGGITMVAGAFLALGQWDIKRLFAYSSISQVGLIVLALGLGTTWGLVGALYHLVNHAVFKPLLFLGSGQIERTAETRDLRRMQGLGAKLPLTSVTCMIGSLSMAGIPPLSGFWSKLIIVFACAKAGSLGWAFLVVAISVVTLAYQLKFQRQAFQSDELAGEQALLTKAPPVRLAESVCVALPMVLLAVGCVALSCLAITGWNDPILIGPAADVLMQGTWEP